MKNLCHDWLLSILILLGLATLVPMVRAVDPPPDGGYSGKNTAEGEDALFSLSSGTSNTALGYHALFRVTTAFGNTATGEGALSTATTGGSNTATGQSALLSNTTGFANTAIGLGALQSNTTGTNNTASGTEALLENTVGTHNTAVGDFAMVNNSLGSNNTACGASALANNLNGNANIALGFQAGASLTIGSNNIAIGNKGVLGESNTIRIGTEGTQTSTFVAGIRATTISGIAVGISPDGQLGTRGSSKRFKDAIKPMDKESEAILGLRPVSFRYKKEFDPKGAPQFGLVAEEVAQVAPHLVIQDEQGRPFTVRYEEVNAMLLNEFLKEHRKGQEQDAKIAQQEKKIEALEQALKEQTTQIQKIGAQLEASQGSGRVADN